MDFELVKDQGAWKQYRLGPYHVDFVRGTDIWDLSARINPSDEQSIAHLQWYPPDCDEFPCEISSVWVEEPYRRQGLASGLYRIAQSLGEIRHSAHRTPAGHYWAQSVGGELPEWEPDCGK